MALNDSQQAAVAATGTTFLLGAAGTGKTTALKQRLLHLLESGEPAYTILILVAEPTHRSYFTEILYEAEIGSYGDLKVHNYVGLAREFVELFWPLVARQAGFVHAHRPPTWLTYDLAQLLMWEVVTPLLDAGHFADLRLRPQQIVSQLLDNLNRSALNGHTITEGIRRQIASWGGDAEHIKHLRDAERAANQFRQICQANNLLDMSLVVEVFNRNVVGHPQFVRYFGERFRHLLVDNLEEQTAAGQNFVTTLMYETVSTTIAFDDGGGYKTFLAADPEYANRFQTLCQQTISFNHRFVDEQGVFHLARQVDRYLFGGDERTVEPEQVRDTIYGVVTGRYRREMVTRLPDFLLELMEDEELAPNEIAIIAPYMDGALRYKLTQALSEADIPYQLTRRRASPREEPRVRSWITLLAVAHPDWHIYPTLYDMAEALQLSIHGLDPARAALIAQSLYQPSFPSLRDPSELTEQQVERIGADVVERVAVLRNWLLANGSEAGSTDLLDQFIHRLFTELLSHRTLRPEPDVQGAAVCDWLVRTATRLREAAPAMGLESPRAIGRAFINGINNGLVTAHPPDLGDPPDPNGVLIATIYSFLLGEIDVPVQVWLETAATGWWDMPRQPLSNTFVLAQSWNPDEQWTLEDDVRIRNELLSRIVHGLTSRCRKGVVLATSELDRRGVRQDGPLWRALQI